MPPWRQQYDNMPVLTMWSGSCKGTTKLFCFCETHSSLHTQYERGSHGPFTIPVCVFPAVEECRSLQRSDMAQNHDKKGLLVRPMGPAAQRPCRTSTMLVQPLEVSLRGLQNIWEDGCTTLAPRLLKSQGTSPRSSRHRVCSKVFGSGGMLPERSGSLFSSPWSCQQCILAWMQCHRTKVTTNAANSCWLLCPASCCKVACALSRGMMYEGITAVGPTCKCSEKWVCLNFCL